MIDQALDRAADDARVAVGRRADRVGGAAEDGLFQLAERDDDAVGRPAEQRRRRRPAWAGARRAISSVTSSTASRSKSTSRRSASSTAIRQSSMAVPGGVTFRARRSRRPSRFVVVPRFSPARATGRNTWAASVLGVGKASTARTNGTLASARRARSRSGKSDSGSAPRRISAWIRPSAAAARMPAVSSPALGGGPAPGGLEPGPAGVERDPPGQESRRQTEVQCAVDVAAPQGGQEPHAGEARSAAAAATVASAGSAKDGRPRITMTGRSSPGSPRSRAAAASSSASECATAEETGSGSVGGVAGDTAAGSAGAATDSAAAAPGDSAAGARHPGRGRGLGGTGRGGGLARRRRLGRSCRRRAGRLR